jgi:hypothetical protein
MKWRPTLVAWHRDLGFFSIGLTVVYAVSGIAVNHRHHWDYNYSKSQEVLPIGVPSALLDVPPGEAVDEGRLARDREAELVAKIGAALGRGEPPRKVFWRGKDRLSLFYGEADEDIADYRPSRGDVEGFVRSDRFLVRAMNFLHLNESRTVWTWFGDAFALILIFLAISGAVIVRGRKGLKGRGGLLTLAGILLPLLAVFLLR